MNWTISVVCLAFLTNAEAAVHYVLPSQSIQTAANDAADHDTVIVEDGNYVESVILLSRSLTIGSRFVLDQDTSHISGTVLNADWMSEDTNSCFALFDGQDAVMQLIGLTLMGGTGTRIHTTDETLLAGGVVLALDQSVTLENCTVREGSADIGAGVCFYASLQSSHLEGQLNRCFVTQCEAVNWGGGVYARFYGLRVSESSIVACNSGNYGGGLWGGGLSYLYMHTCEVRDCQGLTGGVFAEAAEGRICNGLFSGNGNSQTETDFGVCHLETVDNIMVQGNVFANNATNDPAVIMNRFDDRFSPCFVGNVVENHLMQDRVGAIYFFDCEGDVSYNIFRNNFGDRGASVVPSGSGDWTRILHNVFRNNGISEQGRENAGSAILINAVVNEFRINENLFEGNAGDAIGYLPDYVPQNIRAENNWWGDASGPYHAERNPSGQGDTLYGEVIDFEPWLASPPDTVQSAVDRAPLPLTSTWELISVYPNPFNSEIRIEIAGFARDDFRIGLYDLLGRRVADLRNGAISGGTVSFMAPASLSSGVYFLVASDRKQKQSRKVLLLK